MYKLSLLLLFVLGAHFAKTKLSAQQTITVPLNTAFEFTLPLNVGCHFTYQENFLFLLDLMEEFNWLVSSNCNNCPFASKYSVSDDACIIGTERQIIEHGYQDGAYYAFKGYSKINEFSFINPQPKSTANFNLSYIETTINNYTTLVASGGITLAPGSFTEESPEEHIVALLLKQKLITVGQVGINLIYDQSWFGNTSQIIFGGYDTKIVTNSNNFIFENTFDRVSWAVGIIQAKIGNFIIQYTVQTKAFVNPIYHFIMYPQSLTDIHTHVYANCDAGAANSLRTFCYVKEVDYSMFPNIEFKTKNNTYKLKPQDYVVYVARGEGLFEALILLQPHDQKYWVLGLPFVKKYYTLLDFTNKRLGFYQKADNFVNAPLWVTAGSKNKGAAISGFVFFGIFLVATGGLVGWYLFKKKKEGAANYTAVNQI